MFKKIFAALRGRKASGNPYPQDELNLVYKLLFCDDPSLVALQGDAAPGSLFGDSPDARVIQAIADDASEESRVRLLAWHWLRAAGQAVASPTKCWASWSKCRRKASTPSPPMRMAACATSTTPAAWPCSKAPRKKSHSRPSMLVHAAIPAGGQSGP
jgi:hypothetical protein